MEPNNGLAGGISSTMGSGMSGLEISLDHHPQHPPPQNPQKPNPLQQHPHPQTVAYGHHEADHHPQTGKQNYPLAPSGKPQQLALSNEDEPGDSAGDGKKYISLWQRMKWTDSMVKLLIMVVFYIGDEGGSEGNDQTVGKKKGVGVLQKKGKWKSVSRAMMERWFYVSPQQCEDKFNDLNKRYKRVNDILGKGNACRVVENQSLLDTMDHLTPKKKEEVKKLLNSKHLFFREMCAYHNSYGGGGSGGSGSGGGGASVAHLSPEAVAEAPQPIQQHMHGQGCFHSSENALIGRSEISGSKMAIEEEEDDDSEDENENEGEVIIEHKDGHEEDENGDEKTSRKRPRNGTSVISSPLMQQLSTELVAVVQDCTKSFIEKGQWMKSRSLQLEEQRVSYQFEAFEIEKQRRKWVRFSTKKERNGERQVKERANEA